MSDYWDFYFCNVNDELASIFVDLGVRDQVPEKGRPWLLWVWVYMLDSRPDGLTSSEEAEVLFKLEDHLSARIAREADAKLVGRITTLGRREFYFYAHSSIRNVGPISSALEAFPDYRFDWGEEEDPDWQQYLMVLYPSAEDLERIKNRRVLEVLEKHEDDSQQSREIRHWAYFRRLENREAFMAGVRHLGYSVVSSSEDYEYPNPYSICLARSDKADQESIDSAVIELFRLAKTHEGEYDGWETEPVKKIN